MLYKRLIKTIVSILFTFVIIGCTEDSAEKLYPTNDIEASAFYESNLKPIIQEKCISCHVYHLEGANRYDTYEKTKSSISQMIERINSNSNIVMPPADSAQLTDEEKQIFDEFINILNSNDNETARVDVAWTAYKYIDFDSRGPVSGNFDSIDYTLNITDIENPEDILRDAEILIDASSVNVGDEPQRTGNVKLFFSVFTSEISGKIIEYTDTKAIISFTMNGVSIDNISFDIVLEEDQLMLIGSIPDMNLFNWKDGYDALESVCGDFHENKVWQDIDIKAVIKF